MCPINILHLLESGITVVAYDTRSDAMRSLTLQGRALARLADTLDVDRNDVTAISRGLLDNAAMLLQLYRIDTMFVSLTIDTRPLMLLRQRGADTELTTTTDAKEEDRAGVQEAPTSSVGRVEVIGRGVKFAAIKSSSNRLTAAKAYLLSTAATGEAIPAVLDEEEEDQRYR
jgi:hypothetical protein